MVAKLIDGSWQRETVDGTYPNDNVGQFTSMAVFHGDGADTVGIAYYDVNAMTLEFAQTGVEANLSGVDQEPVPGLMSGRRLASYPNPFNPQTKIMYTLAGEQRVQVRIYDVAGRHVRTLVDEFKAAGVHSEVWDGRDLSGRHVGSGTYLVRLVSQEGVALEKVLLLK